MQKIDINDTMSKIDVDLSSVVLLSNTTETLLKNFSDAVQQLDYQGFRNQVNYSIQILSFYISMVVATIATFNVLNGSLPDLIMNFHFILI